MPRNDQDENEPLERAIERRRRQGEPMTAVTTGNKNVKIAGNAWGIAWQHHLESYADYHSRLPRGRTLLRQGKVYDLVIDTGLVTAVAAGPGLYDVTVKIKPLDAETARELQAACAGQAGSLLDLLEGRLGEDTMRRLTAPDAGLFPDRRDIKVLCTCPDDADLCPHGAAVLYGIGLQFDSDPGLFFRLRGVDPSLFFDQARETLAAADGEAQASTPVIAAEDLAGLFGIEIAEGAAPTERQ